LFDQKIDKSVYDYLHDINLDLEII